MFNLSSKHRTIIMILSSLALVLAVIMLIPLFFALYYQDGSSIYRSFVITILMTLTLGLIMQSLSRTQNPNLTLSTSMIVCGLGWFFASLIGSLPLMMGLDIVFIDALFEAVSGFTTTGTTILTNLEQIPQSLIIWRSLMQWLGGLGILTFFLLVTYRNEGEIWFLFRAETHKIKQRRPVPNIFRTIKILWLIYIGLTLLQMAILYAVGVTVFDAIVHSLTTLSTGGFSNYDASIGHFKSAGHPNFILIEYIIILFMFLSGINFFVHFRVLTGNIGELVENFELKYYVGIIGLSAAAIFIAVMVKYGIEIYEVEVVLRRILFQVVALVTTTGYTTENLTSPFFPVLARQLFLVLMFVGGSVGSTAGGFKVLRLALLTRLFRRELKRIHHSRRTVLPITAGKTIIPDSEIMHISAMMIALLILIFIGAGITSLFSDLNGFQSFSGMFSAVGNIGPSFFSVEDMQSLSPVIKVTYIFGMLAGRLEIFPIAILFRLRAWK